MAVFGIKMLFLVPLFIQIVGEHWNSFCNMFHLLYIEVTVNVFANVC